MKINTLAQDDNKSRGSGKKIAQPKDETNSTASV